MLKILKKIRKRIMEEGLFQTVKKAPHLIRVKIKSIIKDKKPTFFSRWGVSSRKWKKIQLKHELNFWKNPLQFQSLDGYPNFREKLFTITKNLFSNVILDFPGGKVLDIGCGPELGFLPYVNAKYKIGIEPLAEELRQFYNYDDDILLITSSCEQLPFCKENIDAIYCTNALDHMRRPYKALNEMYRVLKHHGYFAFSVDIGGTKKHPVKIMEKDLRK